MNRNTPTTVQYPHNMIEGPEFWQAQFRVFQSSTLSRKAFCREHGLDYHRFQYWHHKLGIGGPQAGRLVAIKAKQVAAVSTQLCTVVLKDGLTIKIHDTTVLDHILARLI